MRRLVTHVVGARPNFPKAAPVMRALADRGIEQRLVHTGQHYDDAMSAVFFADLQLPAPDVNLGVGSGSHAQQTATIMARMEGELVDRPPALLVVYGDVNSTLAATLVAVKLGIPVAHVEAGLRSFDVTMPEEVNRIVTDRLSSLLFATSAEALGHLAHDGVSPDRVFFVGNPMIDTLLAHRSAMDPVAAGEGLDLPATYAVATLHRPANVDGPESLAAVVRALHRIADQVDVVLPVHPRGARQMEQAGLFAHTGIHAVEPLPYVRFLGLVSGCAVVVTDSGGLQEETTVLGVPCLTMRPSTERPVTVTHGTNRLTTPAELPAAVAAVLAAGSEPRSAATAGPPLWDGHSGERIAQVIEHVLDGRRDPVQLR